jgi:nucleoside-diphosphate-sugar epimerase
MKILVTGGAGYVGTTLVPLLLDLKHEVTVLDSLMYRGDVLIPFFRRDGFSFIKGDVRDARILQDTVKGQDVVIHLAAIVGLPACRENPELAEQVNYGGSVNVAKAVNDGQQVLFGSTGSNYGEVLAEFCTEETPLNPQSLYGTTKTRAEQFLMENSACTAFRFATAFGTSPRMRLDLLINDLTFQAVRAKYAVVYEAWFMRTFIHVFDMARAFVFAMENRGKMEGSVYNIGSEKMNFSKRDICNIIQAETGAYFHYAETGEDGDKRNYVVSYQKVRNLGYDTTITVQDGVKELVRALQVIKLRNPYSNV